MLGWIADIVAAIEDAAVAAAVTAAAVVNNC
jgi:hypothetical protein